MKTEKSCDNCIYSIPDWTNVCNPDHYCDNQKSEGYGYNVEYLNGCDEWKSIEPNLCNNGFICAKTVVNDEDRITGDTIYRQQAIDEVINLWADKPFGNPTLVEIKDCIEALPSAQQQRKRGRWIEKEYSPFYCSVCGTYQYSASWEIKNKEYNFCPRCGARMDGESE